MAPGKKRGLRRIEDDMHHEGYNPVIDKYGKNRNQKAPNGYDIMFRPIDLAEDKRGNRVISGPSVSVSVAMWTWVLTVVGSFLFGLVYLLVLRDQINSPDTVNAFIVSMVAAIFTVGPMMWSFDTDLRVHTIIGTYDLGFLTAIFMVAGKLGGFAIAGLVVRSLSASDTVLVDSANTAGDFWLLAMSCAVTIFVFIFNDKFEFSKEKETNNHARAAYWTGLWSFGFRLAFWGRGLRSFNSGIYIASLIATNATVNYNVAKYIVIPLIGAPACALILYYVTAIFVAFKDNTYTILRRVNSARDRSPDHDEDYMEAQVSSNSGISPRTQSNIEVNLKKKIKH